MPDRLHPPRSAGLLVPLFSLASAESWGIGEIADLPKLARWCADAGCAMIQMLPVTEMPPAETSPYSSLSAMAIDPQFIAISSMADFAALGGEEALDAPLRERLAEVRRAPRIDYEGVRALKRVVLRRCFEHFHTRDIATGSERARAFDAFAAAEAWWLDDYALFRAIHAAQGECDWREWPDELRRRDPAALDEVRRRLADELTFRKYLQWIAGEQWHQARRDCAGLQLFGDMPFMVSGDSADVWARQDEFRLDVSVGVPPDAFSDTGQDWKLPLYRWDVFIARDFDWLRARARRYATLYDGYRIDHLVGFYRTYFRPLDGSPAEFSPPEQPEQERLGEQVLDALRQAGAVVIAEDLGLVPDFVRESLLRLQLPGYKVLRWEREWLLDGQPFIDPATYPPVSVATSGTHDTEPLVIWWENADSEERQAVLEIPSVRRHLNDTELVAAVATPGLTPVVQAAILQSLFEAGSDFLILPFADAFGWRDRINEPATIGPGNWTWRLPWPVERLRVEPEAVAVAAALGTWSAQQARAPQTGAPR